MTHSIHVANDMVKEKQQLALVHEILHAIIAEYHIKELQDSEGIHYEHVIDQLGLGICSVLKSLHLEVPHGS